MHAYIHTYIRMYIPVSILHWQICLGLSQRMHVVSTTWTCKLSLSGVCSLCHTFWSPRLRLWALIVHPDRTKLTGWKTKFVLLTISSNRTEPVEMETLLPASRTFSRMTIAFVQVTSLGTLRNMGEAWFRWNASAPVYNGCVRTGRNSGKYNMTSIGNHHSKHLSTLCLLARFISMDASGNLTQEQGTWERVLKFVSDRKVSGNWLGATFVQLWLMERWTDGPEDLLFCDLPKSPPSLCAARWWCRVWSSPIK